VQRKAPLRLVNLGPRSIENVANAASWHGCVQHERGAQIALQLPVVPVAQLGARHLDRALMVRHHGLDGLRELAA
jgi:hypothetical protein